VVRGSRSKVGGSRSEPADWVVVERVLAGESMKTNPAERQELIAKLTARGVSAAEIGRRLGVTKRSVQRSRSTGSHGYPTIVAPEIYGHRVPETYEP